MDGKIEKEMKREENNVFSPGEKLPALDLDAMKKDLENKHGRTLRYEKLKRRRGDVNIN